MRASGELSGLPEGQARGGGSRPKLGAEASSFTGAPRSCTVEGVSMSEAARVLGRSAADEAAWQAGVQQSILP